MTKRAAVPPGPRLTKVRALIFEVTHRCNLQCIYCYNVWKGDGPAPSEELGTWRTTRMLKKLFRESGAERITFSGGEPLMRDDLVELAAFARLKKLEASVLTNGKLLDAAWVKDLKTVGMDFYQLTLLGMDEAVHDHHCGQGAQRAILRAIDTIRSNGARAAVAFVMTAKNVHELDEVARYVRSAGLGGFAVYRFNPGGAGLGHQEELAIAPEALLEALSQADEAGKRHKVKPMFAVPIPPCIAPPERYPHVLLAGCAAGRPQGYVTVDPVGNVRMCSHNPVVLGNIRKQSFAELMSHEHVHAFMDGRPDECADCEHWGACQGGCRASSLQLGLPPSALDPYVASLLSKGMRCERSG